MRSQITLDHQRREVNRRPTIQRPILICLTTLLVVLLVKPPTFVGAMWMFQSPTTNQTLVGQAPRETQRQLSQAEQVKDGLQQINQAEVPQTTNYGTYGSSLLSIAGIQPTNIASLLNTVGDTGFKYFNINDQCRNRAACDLGYMLFKKLSFVHNWLIRTSVRTLTDMNNLYTQSWMEGMIGKNCTAIYVACRQSPLEGIMNLALLQRLAL